MALGAPVGSGRKVHRQECPRSSPVIIALNELECTCAVLATGEARLKQIQAERERTIKSLRKMIKDFQ